MAFRLEQNLWFLENVFRDTKPKSPPPKLVYNIAATLLLFSNSDHTHSHVPHSLCVSVSSSVSLALHNATPQLLLHASI